LITAFSFLIIYSLPTTFWTQIFSVEFTAIKSILKPLALGILVFSCSNILNHYFHAKNKFKLIVLANSIGLVLCLASAYWLIPLHGLNGAAWAWSIGLSSGMISYLYFFIFKKDTNPLTSSH
jgi:O-antigen/teichoic acid export membrane protein